MPDHTSSSPQNADQPKLVDKAEWHLEQTQLLGLPDEYAAHHIAFFLRWLHERGLTSAFFREEFAEQLTAIQAGQLTWPSLIWDYLDGCLLPDMVTTEGNDFGAAYFSHARGRFSEDYVRSLAAEDRRQALRALFTDENFIKLAPVFDQRLAEWKVDPASVIKPFGTWGKVGIGCLVLGPCLLIGGLLAFVISLPVQHYGSKLVAGYIRLGSFFAMVIGLATVGVLLLFAYASRRRKALREKQGDGDGDGDGEA